MPRYKTQLIIEALQATNGLVSLAAKRLGCTPQTIYTRAKRVQSVQRTIDDCRAELVDHAELALRGAILGKEPWAVALTLKTLGKNRGYVERQEVTGADGGSLELRIVERIIGDDDADDPTA
jgi:hypothetical protein